jgi:phage terminase small subunit
MNHPIPTDPRHQRFADELIKGSTLVDAYLAAGFKCTRVSALQNAKRLRKRADIDAYITSLQRAAADASTLSLLEKRRFLARVVRTPLAKLDPEDPDHAHGDLVKSFALNESENSTSRRIEKLDPLKAIELDNKLDASSPENEQAAALTEAILSLGSGNALPGGKL